MIAMIPNDVSTKKVIYKQISDWQTVYEALLTIKTFSNTISKTNSIFVEDFQDALFDATIAVESLLEILKIKAGVKNE